MMGKRSLGCRVQRRNGCFTTATVLYLREQLFIQSGFLAKRMVIAQTPEAVTVIHAIHTKPWRGSRLGALEEDVWAHNIPEEDATSGSSITDEDSTMHCKSLKIWKHKWHDITSSKTLSYHAYLKTGGWKCKYQTSTHNIEKIFYLFYLNYNRHGMVIQDVSPHSNTVSNYWTTKRNLSTRHPTEQAPRRTNPRKWK